MAPFLRFWRCLVFLRNFAKWIYVVLYSFTEKSCMIHYSISILLVHSVLMGCHGYIVFQIWNISLNFRDFQPRDPIKGRLRHDSLPMEQAVLFFSVENLADWLLNAHGWEVGCKFAELLMFFFWLALLSGSGAGLVGAGLLKELLLFFQSLPTWKWNSSNNSLQILLFFSLEPFWQQHHSVATTQHKVQNLTPRFLLWHLICKAQIFRVFPTQTPPQKKQQRTPIFGCLAAWIRGLSLKFPWKLVTG